MEAAGASTSRARWEVENEVQEVEDVDELLRWNPADVQTQLQRKPWSRDPRYFRKVKISALALLKMAMHARSGGNLEVMGMVQGKVAGDTFVVVDAFALPVEGTETRVNAHDQAYEFMVNFQSASQAAGRPENVCGWYHSHPGYGCWLSGIDVGTQTEQQQFQDPFVAIVIDPVKTAAAGKVEVGAFRTYPKGHTPADRGAGEHQSIPLEKIEEYGVHAKHYYALEVSFFKSKVDAQYFDLMWSKYWASTLSSDPLVATRPFATSQMLDVAQKLEKEAARIAASGGAMQAEAATRRDEKLQGTRRDAAAVAVETLKGLATHSLKGALFRTK